MSKRSITASTVAFALLAVISLVVLGAGVSDYRRMSADEKYSRDAMVEAKAKLDKIHYDADGNVLDADRARYEDAMTTLKVHADTPRFMANQKKKTYPLIGGGGAGFLVFVILAVRSTRRRA